MKKVIKAELWDRVHFLMRDYWDGMIRCILSYQGEADEAVFRDAALYVFRSVPVLHSRYQNRPLRPRWIEETVRTEEILKILPAEDIGKETYAFISESIPASSPVQARFGLIKGTGEFAVCFLCNHMCCDGGDFKYLVGLFAQTYSALCRGEACPPVKNGSRAYGEMYSGLDEASAKEAKRLYRNVSASKKGRSLPFSDCCSGDKPIFAKKELSEAEFLRLKEVCRRKGVTVNDVLQAAFAETVYEYASIPPKEGLQISCMRDLRKTMRAEGNETGITNHTGFLTCRLKTHPGGMEKAAGAVHEIMEKQKADRFAGMYGIPLLRTVQLCLPEILASRLIRLGYKSPLYSVSNLGIADSNTLSLNGNKPYDIYMTGTVKYKPAVQLSAVTMKNCLHLTFAVQGSSYDWVLLSEMLASLREKICSYALC